MIIDFISDTHQNYKHLEDKLTGDVLVHCGDWSRDGSEEETEAFLEWFKSQPHEHKIATPGNHERFIESEWRKDPDWLALDWWDGHEIHLLLGVGHNTSVRIEGVKFYGMPYTQFYNNWAFAYDNAEHAKELCEAIPMDTDILITHGPAYETLDENSHRHQLGCPHLREAVERVRPIIHAFGHVHESAGSQKLSNLTAYPYPALENLNCAQTHFQREVVTVAINKGDKND